MAILLGIDTGGTYTDAVLYDDTAPAPGLVAKAKALTTRHDLSLGIGAALDTVLNGDPAQGCEPGGISLVSVSTTLATNALVEGQGGRILLILIGFEPQALERGGLGDALGADPVIFAAGGHTPSGERQAPFDRASVETALAEHEGTIDGVAVVAYFGTRDPTDEIAARDIITAQSSLPVTCGHELSSDLNGPKRALTAVLNARLIGMIAGLIDATETILKARGITAPLMLVRGDGSLVSAAFARSRPIETILSGPAASLVGAAHLTGLSDAVVSDIGGTTTDIAILQAGLPALSPDGATVGGHHTMVEAVDMRTHGLGGDSEVQVDDTHMRPRLLLGPRRAVPLSLLAVQHGPAVHHALDMQLRTPTPGPHDARFVLRTTAGRRTAGLRPTDHALLDQLNEQPVPVQTLVSQRAHGAALRRLVGRGLVAVSTFTPSDAAHVLGQHQTWDEEAARKGALLLARRRTASGQSIATDANTLSTLVLHTLVTRSANVLFDASAAHDGFGPGMDSTNPLVAIALDGHSGTTRIDVGLDKPIVGLGASAHLYYPRIAKRLRTDVVVPPDADVANALGAVVGNVRLIEQAVITQPAEGCFRVHLKSGSADYPSELSARAAAFEGLRRLARAAAELAGAGDVEMSETWDERRAQVESREMLVEATARVTASGRPRLATG